METQAATSFGRTDSNVVFLPGHPPDASASSPPDSAPDSHRTAIGRTYTFKQAAELLACNESTLRRRYWEEKIEPAFRHCPKPLQTIAKYDTKGKPVYRLNEVAIEVFRAFLAAKAEGNEDAFLLAAREQYPASAVSPEPPAIRPDVLPPADAAPAANSNDRPTLPPVDRTAAGSLVPTGSSYLNALEEEELELSELEADELALLQRMNGNLDRLTQNQTQWQRTNDLRRQRLLRQARLEAAALATEIEAEFDETLRESQYNIRRGNVGKSPAATSPSRSA